jgi:prepilin-type N-terminal cleavage/methylation domain-containing protein
MKLGFFKKGEKGFTLVELMVVMAIIAILSSIVLPAVTGTKQTSQNSQVMQDATSVEDAVNNFNAQANVAAGVSTDNTSVFGETTAQVVSSKWPELAITTTYSTEFPASAGEQANTVEALNFQALNGSTIFSGNVTGFVAVYTVVDIDTLVDDGYMQEEPVGFDLVFSSSKSYHSYLWLLKKGVVYGEYGGSTAGRTVQVFRLKTIETDTADTLTYQRVY